MNRICFGEFNSIGDSCNVDSELLGFVGVIIWFSFIKVCGLVWSFKVSPTVKAKPEAKKKKPSNEAARDKYYEQLNAKADELHHRINFFEPRQRDVQQRNTLPTWKMAAAAVFDSSSSSSSGYVNERNYDSDADFRPANHHSAMFQRDHSELAPAPSPMHTQLTATPAKNVTHPTGEILALRLIY